MCHQLKRFIAEITLAEKSMCNSSKAPSLNCFEEMLQKVFFLSFFFDRGIPSKAKVLVLFSFFLCNKVLRVFQTTILIFFSLERVAWKTLFPAGNQNCWNIKLVEKRFWLGHIGKASYI